MKLWSLCKFSFKIEKYCRNYQFPCIFLFLFEKFSLLDLDPQPWLEGGTCLQCCCVSAGSASWDGPLCAGTICQSQFFKSFFLCHIYVGLRTWSIGTGFFIFIVSSFSAGLSDRDCSAPSGQPAALQPSPLPLGGSLMWEWSGQLKYLPDHPLIICRAAI